MPNIIPMMMASAGGVSLADSGKLYAWGQNGVGQFGNNATSYSNVCSPVQTGSDEDWSLIVGDENSIMATRNDGTLWAWGDGLLVPNGTTGGYSSPVQIGALKNWPTDNSKIMGAGTTSANCIKTDGTLWGWGGNDNGGIGDGTTTRRDSPVQVGSLSDWDTIDYGKEQGIAVKTDGTMWAWGANGDGILGLGDTTNRSSPTQIGSLTPWAKAAISQSGGAAVKTDGTLWQWGIGDLMADGTSSGKSSPVQIGSETYWSDVWLSDNSGHATDTSGRAWGFGANQYGAIGDGATTARHSPVQVGSLTNWDKFFTIGWKANILHLKTDGTLWGWGLNTNGQLGIGDITNRSSPVQVGGLTTWMSVGNSLTVGLGIIKTSA